MLPRRLSKTNRLDLAGQTFGPWVVLHEVPRPIGLRQQGTFWLSRCRCGGEQIISGGRLTAGRFSRGCENCRSHGATKGGITPEYQSWRGMRERCVNPNHASYSRYGGRGVSVCSRWMHSFDAFLQDMGKRPKGTSLDRINSDGNYEPGNCRWADAKTQVRNSSSFILSDEQVAAIIVLLSHGARHEDVAAAVGVSRSHISNIAVGKSRTDASPRAREIREHRHG